MPKFKFKNSTTASATPTLITGEIGINSADTKGYVGNSSGSAIKFIGTVANQDSNNVNITGGNITVSSFTSAAVSPSTITVGGTAVSTVGGAAPGSSNTLLASQAGATFAIDKKLEGRLKNVYTWAAAGTFTYVKSGEDVKSLRVLCCGGGGGARSYSECGGGGGFTERMIDATGITTVTVTVGGGGTGGAYFGFSNDGGTSSFGGYCSASGGYGSSRNSQHNGGHGGLGYGGNINTYGGMGGSHNNMDQYSNSSASGGVGGGTYFGGCMQGDRPDWSLSSTYAAPGTGGVAISSGHNGQGGRTGKPGIVIVYEYR